MKLESPKQDTIKPSKLELGYDYLSTNLILRNLPTEIKELLAAETTTQSKESDRELAKGLEGAKKSERLEALICIISRQIEVLLRRIDLLDSAVI